MGTVEFKREESATPDKAVLENLNDNTALATPGNFDIGGVSGDMSNNDIPIPYLQIAYGVGGLAEKFNPGDLVLDKEHLLVAKGHPLTMVILHAHYYWKEWVTPEMRVIEVQGRTFATEAEVKAAGGTTEWTPESKPTFSKAAALSILIRKPEGIACSYFVIDIAGSKWAPAKWIVDKTAYKRKGGKGVGVTLAKELRFALSGRTDLPENQRLVAGLWEVTTGFETVGGNNMPMPTLKLVGQNDAAFIAELQQALKS